MTINNVEGSIIVSGNIRAEQVKILAAKDFALNTDAWFHTNQDPRQYLSYDDQRAQAVSQSAAANAIPPIVRAVLKLFFKIELPPAPQGYIAYGVNGETPVDTTSDELDAAINRDESRHIQQLLN